MGYTAGKTELMIGLGMSSISDSWYAFAQNEKDVDTYTEKVNAGIIPIFRGHLLTDKDLIIRKHILNLMCNLETEWNVGLNDETKNEIVKRLSEIIEDGLIEVFDNKIVVKEEGRMFVRNICMAFDLRLVENQPDIRIFSMTI
jgi:oxygen-independent coproporphyrinogen-3 oxidase